jgi:hypothetical protein
MSGMARPERKDLGTVKLYESSGRIESLPKGIYFSESPIFTRMDFKSVNEYQAP